MTIWKKLVVAAIVALALSFSATVAKADGIPIGIVLLDTPKGVQVVGWLQGGIADRCMPRLRPGATITTLNGVPLKSADQFQKALQNSTFVKFQFVDAAGELRWGRAWSGGPAACYCQP